MNIFKDVFKKQSIKKDGIIAIGYFDSMHLGHQKILSELLKKSEQKKLDSFVLTYAEIPSKEKTGKKILEFKEKKAFFKKFGIKNLIIAEFNEKFQSMTPVDFVNLLRNNFRISEYVISKDFSFGSKRAGNRDTLIKLGCSVDFVEPIYQDNTKISTTIIKQHILKGEIETANKLTGRPFHINGIVHKGKQIGRTLGFPTMNIKNTNICNPPDGVYITKTIVKNKEYNSITYIANSTIESHLVNYHKFKYNFKIKVDFFKKIRDNISFDSQDLLVKQIQTDLEKSKTFFNI